MSTDTASQTRPRFRSRLRAMAVGWLTLFASFGIEALWVFTPLGNVLSWSFPNHPWMYSVMRALSTAENVVMVAVPVAAVALPGSRVWARMSERAIRLARGAWWVWMAAGLPGWIALAASIATTDGGDRGLGLVIVIAGPVLLIGVGVIALIAWLVPRPSGVAPQEQSGQDC